MAIRSKKTLVGIGVVFIIAVATYFLVDDAEFFESYFSIPAVGALVSALFVLLKDYLAYERELLLQDRKNNFLVGASSHMANVAFDKHVEFAEAYIEEAHSALVTLFQEGPTDEALKHATALYEIQKKYRVWLTVEIEKRIDRFEALLRKIGAGARYEKRTEGRPQSEERIKSLYKAFAEIVGLEEWEGDTITSDNAVISLIQSMRSILGTEELTKLRSAIVQKAATQITSDSPQ